MAQRLIVIDGYSLLFRAYYALPPMTTPDGEPTGAVYGFLSMLLRLLDESKPQALVVAFDPSGPTFRHKTYPEYKAGRKETPPELRSQFQLCRDTLSAMHIATACVPGYEADDLLGTIAKQATAKGWETWLVTGDRDALQLIDGSTQVLLTRRGISDVDFMTADKLQDLWGVSPERVPDLKGLMGDASDNIPGIAGVGEKTAMKLLGEYGSLDGVLDAAHAIKGKLGERLRENGDAARLSRSLATIDRDVPYTWEPDECRLPVWSETSAHEQLEKLGMRTLMGRLGVAPPAPAATAPKREWLPETIIEAPHELARAASAMIGDGVVALLWEDGALTLACADGRRIRAQLQGDLATPGMDQHEALLALSGLLGSYTPKVFYDAKAWLARLRGLDVHIESILGDALIAAYLLDAQARSYEMNDLCAQILATRANVDAAALWGVHAFQLAQIKENGLLGLYQDIELPLMRVLADMEAVGFAVDADRLREIGASLDAEIGARRDRIYELAGESFNISSPKQLGAILYEKLGVPTGKMTKGKTAHSTDADTLEPLAQEYPIIGEVLEYRHLAKLKGTYIDGLLQAAGGNKRVHSTFNQTVTSTGRISSTEPNLQNIPVRTQQGRVIRSAFVAQEGWVLVDADYSQIELRVLAHMSGDAALIEAFQKGQDIHARTASEVFGVPIDEVTDEMRSSAKAVNFGIVYGISSFGLSRNTGSSRAQAGEFMKMYFDRYPGVRTFMDEQVLIGKTRGYVTTLFGRRRDLPELKSSNYATRSFGERVAMNTPIQGTAADIIKLAMNRVHAALKEADLRARLILQVHDELIVEAPIDEAERAAALLRERMQSVVTLKVPLVADVGVGRTWLEA